MKGQFQDKGIPMKMQLFLPLLALLAPYCSGLPAWIKDYDSSLFEDAINASIMKVNRQLYSRNLFGVVKSSVRTVDFQFDDIIILVLDLNIQETTCTKASRQDPSTCEFQRGPYSKVAYCRSWVQVSEEQVQEARVQCQHEDSSSESSSSSEEMFWGRQDLNRQRSNTKFSSRTTSQTYPAGKKSKKSQRTVEKTQNRYEFE
ncbi:secreted phosphoprotein 24 [Lissotriton helveticus]